MQLATVTGEYFSEKELTEIARSCAVGATWRIRMNDPTTPTVIIVINII